MCLYDHSCHHAEYLCIDNTRELLDLLWDYRSKWNLLGIQLGIDDSTLEAIDMDQRKTENALVEVIKKWLRRVDPRPTRSALTMALQSECLAGKATSTQGTYPTIRMVANSVPRLIGMSLCKYPHRPCSQS